MPNLGSLFGAFLYGSGATVLSGIGLLTFLFSIPVLVFRFFW